MNLKFRQIAYQETSKALVEQVSNLMLSSFTSLSRFSRLNISDLTTEKRTSELKYLP